jgi:hypothetical protein
MIADGPLLFGTRARTRVLVATALLEETYPRELTLLLALPLVTIQRAVDRLEREGVLASRRVGVQRMVRLNPRYFALNELQPLLLRLARGMPDVARAVSALRRRPRRAGKTI